MVLWEQEAMEIFTNSDFGFFGNLIPIILIVGISWGISKKPRDILYIQLPLTLAFKVFFPFLNISIVLLSVALCIMNIVGSKGDMLADVKGIPKKVRDVVMRSADITKQINRKLKLEELGRKVGEKKAQLEARIK